jgi:RNA polymerase sigma-70 factor (ECF subfamily)
MPPPELADPSRPTRGASPDVAALVGAARAGDRSAFGTLYERYARMVHGVLLGAGQRDDVQDLVQDVFLRALRQLHTLREPAAFGGWLATLARNEARMHHRSTRDTVELTEQIPGSPPAEPTLEMEDVMRAMRTLPERYREPLLLRLVNQMSGEEIALTMGLTHGTVRVYLHHGMKLLREQLGGRGEA